MANNNYFAHNSQNGTTPFQRMTTAGYSWSAAGENIAAGYPTVAGVMAAWLGDYGHCANIMSANFADVGVACVINNSSTYKSYWTMDLGRH